MPRMTALTVEHAGRKWSDAWEIDGTDVLVSSAYGSYRVPLGLAKAENVAARILLGIVERRAR
jgi:hypothetical protein